MDFHVLPKRSTMLAEMQAIPRQNANPDAPVRYGTSSSVLTIFCFSFFPARTAFEKLTDFDYRGLTYYTVRNLSLYECQGWCREEAECQAAAFSFVPNPLAPMQDTVCQLQNETGASNPGAQAQRAANMYYMVKLQLRSGTFKYRHKLTHRIEWNRCMWIHTWNNMLSYDTKFYMVSLWRTVKTTL